MTTQVLPCSPRLTGNVRDLCRPAELLRCSDECAVCAADGEVGV